MAVQEVIQIGCEYSIIVAAGGSAFHFVKGALRGSSKGRRVAGGVEELKANGPRVRRWAAWFGVMTAIKAGLLRARGVHDPFNFAAAWGGTNALFAAYRGEGPRAAVREALKGAAYSVVTALAGGGLLFLLQPPDSSDSPAFTSFSVKRSTSR